jgi:hypothetical protein
MIIWGSRGITSTQAKGEFDCPSCAAHVPYEQKRVRRFFTLYFIPLIPLDTVTTYIECQRCNRTYDNKVLEYRLPPSMEELQRRYAESFSRVLAIAAGVDGAPGAHRLAVLAEQIARTGQPAPDDERLRSIPAEAASTDLAKLFADLAGMVTDRGREALFTAAYNVLVADAPLTQAGQQFMNRLASALGLSEAHRSGLMASLQRQSPR